MRKKSLSLAWVALLFWMLLGTAAVSQALVKSTNAPAPPNGPAQVEFAAGKIKLTYHGMTILEAKLGKHDSEIQMRTQVYQAGDKVEQVILFFGKDGRAPIKLAGTINGSDESFPCESDRRDRRGAGPLIVRHVSGLSRSFLNRAVYDRRGDWVLSVDGGPKVTVMPEKPAPASAGKNSFALFAEGSEIVLRFRPRFYQKHRGLPFFEPWIYKPWPNSAAGWISWFAFFDKITEKDVVETAEVFSEALRPFGYEYFQIDDGYQRALGAPEMWLTPNDKFPRGLKFLADFIKQKGLTPGIWTAAAIHDRSLVEAHPQWFVRDGRGEPVWGNWIGYAFDASVPEALDAVVRPLYRGLRGQGWEYFKLDSLRHLRYEGYNANRDHFDRKKADLAGTYRRYVQAVRDEIGRDKFLLGCWGIRPELAGLIDACRIGDDGFAYAGLAQYNSFNNVVWRNDPDHIELTKDGFRSTMVTTLTGSLIMLTDKPGVYRTAAIEPAKRAAPVLFTLPGQIYDVDPSRSQYLEKADVEVSGSGPRVFDGGYTPACHLYLLEIDRPFENWSVLGRTGGDFDEIRFADLGLDPDREYLVFEFWSKKLLGRFKESFPPGPVDREFGCQALCVRESKPHPQLVATGRHVTCGGPDLSDVRWDGTGLTGASLSVKGDPCILYLTEPRGFAFERAEARGAKVEKADKEGSICRITLIPDKNGPITWSARFQKK